MKKTPPHIRFLVLLLSAWLVGAQTLVLAHDATHSAHIHKQFCDDMGAISGNLVAAIADITLPSLQPLPFVPVTIQRHKVNSRFDPAYQSRAPPAFTN